MSANLLEIMTKGALRTGP